MNRYFPLFLIAFASFVVSCNKKDAGTPAATANTAATTSTYNPHKGARMSGPNYSQSISMETANNMIQSYLTSVSYPYIDTSLRALSFDADTLRAYLKDPRIVTVKFVLAHQPAYVQSSFGKYSGMKPNALTLIVVGLDEANQIVRNSSGGFYEHFDPCPVSCPGGTSDALLH